MSTRDDGIMLIVRVNAIVASRGYLNLAVLWRVLDCCVRTLDRDPFLQHGKGAEATLHCFGIPMALAIILAEREMAVLLGLCSFLESWLFKGFYIS